MNNEKLVKKARKGNNAAFEKLIYEYQHVMYRVAKSIVKKDEDSADVLQEAILKAYQSIAMLREPHYFKTWLIRIVMNECYSLIRTRKKVVPMKDWTDPPEIEDKYLSIEIEMLLDMLPEKDEQILRLFYIEDIRIKDISSLLNIPENTAKTRIRRAKQKFSQLLNEDKEVEWGNGKLGKTHEKHKQ